MKEKVKDYIFSIGINLIIGGFAFFNKPNSQILQILTGLSIVILTILLPNKSKILRFCNQYRDHFPIIRAALNIGGVLILYAILSDNGNIKAGVFNIDFLYSVILIVFWISFITTSLLGIKTELIANTTTCIPFEENNDTITVWLINNPNFEMWQFPGGHVDLNNSTPEEIAIKKAEIEAGVTVDLVDPYEYKIVDYDNCCSKKAPHFQYWISIDKDAKCRKTIGHEYHFDYTYIGMVSSSQHKPSFQRVQIELGILSEINDEMALHQNILSQINKEDIKLFGKRRNGSYTEDLSARIFAGCQALKKIRQVSK